MPREKSQSKADLFAPLEQTREYHLALEANTKSRLNAKVQTQSSKVFFTHNFNKDFIVMLMFFFIH